MRNLSSVGSQSDAPSQKIPLRRGHRIASETQHPIVKLLCEVQRALWDAEIDVLQCDGHGE